MGFNLFGKKPAAEPSAAAEDSAPPEQKVGEIQNLTGNPKLDIEITKIKAQLDSFSEVRKAINERFTRNSEQMGELRAMLAATDKEMSQVQVKMAKAVDLVEAVQPDKMMIDLQKMDGKIDALKASLESNDSIMKALGNEIKDIRLKMSTFKGLEQVIKLSEDAKAEFTAMKKVEATIAGHSDKVETIFTDFQKNYREFSKVTDEVKALTKSSQEMSSAIDQLRVKTGESAHKKEFDTLVNKFSEFERHVGNVVDLLEKKASDLPKDLKDRFETLDSTTKRKLEDHFSHAQKMVSVLEAFEKKYPDFAAKMKTFEIKEGLVTKEPEKAEVKVEEKKEETKDEKKEEKKGGLFGGILAKKEEAPKT